MTGLSIDEYTPEEGPVRVAAQALVHLLDGDVESARKVGWFHPTELSYLSSWEWVSFPGLAGVPPRVRAEAALSWPGIDAEALRSFWYVPSSLASEYSCPLVLDLEGLGLIMGHPAAAPEHWVDLAVWLSDTSTLPSRAPDWASILQRLSEISLLGEVVSALVWARTPEVSLRGTVLLLAGNLSALEVFRCLCLEAAGFPATDLDHFNHALFRQFSHPQVCSFAELAVLTVSSSSS